MILCKRFMTAERFTPQFDEAQTARITATKEQLENRPPTYVDFLTHATAQSGFLTFSMDSHRWMQTVLALKDKNPDLFENVYFDKRDMRTLYSDQVMAFLGIMRQSDSFGSIEINGNHEYLMHPDTSQAINNSRRKVLEPHQEAIEEMAQIIGENLGTNTLEENFGDYFRSQVNSEE